MTVGLTQVAIKKDNNKTPITFKVCFAVRRQRVLSPSREKNIAWWYYTKRATPFWKIKKIKIKVPLLEVQVSNSCKIAKSTKKIFGWKPLKCPEDESEPDCSSHTHQRGPVSLPCNFMSFFRLQPFSFLFGVFFFPSLSSSFIPPITQAATDPVVETRVSTNGCDLVVVLSSCCLQKHHWFPPQEKSYVDTKKRRCIFFFSSGVKHNDPQGVYTHVLWPLLPEIKICCVIDITVTVTVLVRPFKRPAHQCWSCYSMACLPSTQCSSSAFSAQLWCNIIQVCLDAVVRSNKEQTLKFSAASSSATAFLHFFHSSFWPWSLFVSSHCKSAAA